MPLLAYQVEEGVPPADDLVHDAPERLPSSSSPRVFLPVANKAVAAIPEVEFNSKYLAPTDHAEGVFTMEVCAATRAKIQGMELRLLTNALMESSLEPPDQDVAARVQEQPEGMKGVVPGATDPERMTREVFWNDNKAHFAHDKTAPEQLEAEQPTPNFVHTSAQQFQETTALLLVDLTNRPHLNKDDFHVPLKSAEVRASPRLRH